VDAQREVMRAEADERNEIRSAAKEYSESAAEYEDSLDEAGQKEARADRIRHHARDLTDEADLP
jgi:hypothetical protein